MRSRNDSFRLYIAVDEKGNLGKSLKGERYYVIVGSVVVDRKAFEDISRYYATIRGREIKYHDDWDLREPMIRRAAPYVENVYYVKYHKGPVVHNTPDGLPKNKKVALHIRMIQTLADQMIADAGLEPIDIEVDYNRLVAGEDIPSVFECSPSRNGRGIECKVVDSASSYGLMTNDMITGAVGDAFTDPQNVEARRLVRLLKNKPKEVHLRNLNRKTTRRFGNER